MNEGHVTLNEKVKNHRYYGATDYKDPGVRNPVENKTPSQNTDVQAETVDFKNSESLVSEEIVCLSFEVVLLSEECTFDINTEEDCCHGEERHNADVDV
jgi:hypothetical protein